MLPQHSTDFCGRLRSWVRPLKPRSQILVLTDGAYLDVPSSTRRQKTLSLILLHSLITPSRWHAVHKPASKIPSLITPVGGKRKGTKERAAVQTISSPTLSDRLLRCGAQHTLQTPSLRQPQAPPTFEIPPSAKQAVQVWTRVGKVDTGWRRSGVQVSAQVPVPVGVSNDSRKTPSWLTRQVIPSMT